jgi:hypothetical protein
LKKMMVIHFKTLIWYLFRDTKKKITKSSVRIAVSRTEIRKHYLLNTVYIVSVYYPPYSQ